MMADSHPTAASTEEKPAEQLVEIESQDVIRLILQFLKENKLFDSLHLLQEEAGIVLNTVDNVTTFTNDIKNGRWDLVLPQIATLKLPADKLVRSSLVFDNKV